MKYPAIGDVVNLQKSMVASMTFPIQDGERTIAKVEARMTSLIFIEIPTVVLLCKDSTPQRFEVDASSEKALVLAIEKLLENDECFYTLLHPMWAVPAFLWRKVV